MFKSLMSSSLFDIIHSVSIFRFSGFNYLPYYLGENNYHGEKGNISLMGKIILKMFVKKNKISISVRLILFNS